MVTATQSLLNGRPPPAKRPVYRSEFVIRLQNMREKRGKNFAFDFASSDLFDEPIDWRTPSVPVRTNVVSRIMGSSVNNDFNTSRYSRNRSGPKPLKTASISSTNIHNNTITSSRSATKRPSSVIRACRFNENVDIFEIDDYDRKVDKSWTRLTQFEKLRIRCELNDFKTSEMIIHRESRHYTRLHRI